MTLDEGEDEKQLYGILDGGNTNARINSWREGLDGNAVDRLSEAFVNVQVLVPHLRGEEPSGEMLNLLNDIH